MSAEDQFFELQEAEGRCWTAAGKLKDMAARAEATLVCAAIRRRADIILKNAAKIDKAIFGGAGVPRNTAQSAAQARSDKTYDGVYWNYLNKPPADKQAAYDDILHRPTSLPSRQPALDALWHLMHGTGYDPPRVDPNAPAPHPHPTPGEEEQPDLG